MQRVKSTLPDTGFPIIIIAWANILLLLFVCALLKNHSLPQFGFDVVSSESHFNISRIDRTQTHFITITAGDKPRLFLDMTELPNSREEIVKALEGLAGKNASRTHIVIIQDEAVAVGAAQQIIDEILRLGYRCSLAARPARD